MSTSPAVQQPAPQQVVSPAWVRWNIFLVAFTSFCVPIGIFNVINGVISRDTSHTIWATFWLSLTITGAVTGASTLYGLATAANNSKK